MSETVIRHPPDEIVLEMALEKQLVDRHDQSTKLDDKWPGFHNNWPDGEQMILFKDTEGIAQDATMYGDHADEFGISIMVRGIDETKTRIKINQLKDEFDKLTRYDVRLEGIKYRIHCLRRSGQVNFLGKEPGDYARYLFTVNYLTPIRRV